MLGCSQDKSSAHVEFHKPFQTIYYNPKDSQYHLNEKSYDELKSTYTIVSSISTYQDTYKDCIIVNPLCENFMYREHNMLFDATGNSLSSWWDSIFPANDDFDKCDYFIIRDGENVGLMDAEGNIPNST